MKLITYTDGGARGNPGPAALGVVIQNEQGEVLVSYGEYLGVQTNNVAEYQAIISALHKAKELGATEVECRADSKLVIEQLKGKWKVKEPHLQTLFMQAWKAMQVFTKVRLVHVPRAQNAAPDKEVNKALNARRS